MSFPISTPTTFSNDGVTLFLNTTDTTDLSTSSVVFSGGIAVSKNMYTGGNIGMTTSGGTISIIPTSQANVNISIPSLGGVGDTLVFSGLAQTLTNKTFTAPVISSIINTGTLTLPTSTDTLVGRATTDTLTNKSLNNTSVFHVDGTDATKRIGFVTSGATTGTTLTLAGIQTTARTITFPNATDQVVCRATTDTLTNKTLTAPVISSIVNTGTLTLPTTSDTLVGRATTDTLTNKTITSTTNNVAANILNSATTAVNVSAAAAPSSGKVLTATSSTTATWQNMIFGYQADTTVYSTTSTTYVTLKTFTTSSLAAGTYLLSWYIEAGNSVVTGRSSYRIVLSPSTVLGETLAIEGTYSSFHGFIQLSGISGVQTINIDGLRNTASNTARIRNCRIYLQYSS